MVDEKKEPIEGGQGNAADESANPNQNKPEPPLSEEVRVEEPEVKEPTAELLPTPSEKEIEEGKAFSILSYALGIVGIPFFLVPLIMRNNSFSLFHAKQCLMIWLTAIVGGVISSILAVICIGLILGLILGIFLLVVSIMGIISASNGEVKPLPVIGQWGVEWFKGLTVA